MWDQPAGIWRAQQYAGQIWRLLEEERQATDAYPLEDRLSQAEIKMLIDKIRPVRQRIKTCG